MTEPFLDDTKELVLVSRTKETRSHDDEDHYGLAEKGKLPSNNSTMVHPYSDHRQVPISDPRLFVKTVRATVGKKLIISLLGRRVNFPRMLYEVLCDATKDDFDHIVSWRHHGRAFQIYDKAAFEKDILPRYFGATQYGSFVRQLYLYNFTKVTSGADTGVHFHERFLRGRPDLATDIKRKPRGTKRREIVIAPDFSSLPKCDYTFFGDGGGARSFTTPSSTLNATLASTPAVIPKGRSPADMFRDSGFTRQSHQNVSGFSSKPVIPQMQPTTASHQIGSTSTDPGNACFLEQEHHASSLSTTFVLDGSRASQQDSSQGFPSASEEMFDSSKLTWNNDFHLKTDTALPVAKSFRRRAQNASEGEALDCAPLKCLPGMIELDYATRSCITASSKDLKRSFVLPGKKDDAVRNEFVNTAASPLTSAANETASTSTSTLLHQENSSLLNRLSYHSTTGIEEDPSNLHTCSVMQGEEEEVVLLENQSQYLDDCCDSLFPLRKFHFENRSVKQVGCQIFNTSLYHLSVPSSPPPHQDDCQLTCDKKEAFNRSL